MDNKLTPEEQKKFDKLLIKSKKSAEDKGYIPIEKLFENLKEK